MHSLRQSFLQNCSQSRFRSNPSPYISTQKPIQDSSWGTQTRIQPFRSYPSPYCLHLPILASIRGSKVVRFIFFRGRGGSNVPLQKSLWKFPKHPWQWHFTIVPTFHTVFNLECLVVSWVWKMEAGRGSLISGSPSDRHADNRTDERNSAFHSSEKLSIQVPPALSGKKNKNQVKFFGIDRILD